jgi:hypothetical protein
MQKIQTANQASLETQHTHTHNKQARLIYNTNIGKQKTNTHNKINNKSKLIYKLKHWKPENTPTQHNQEARLIYNSNIGNTNTHTHTQHKHARLIYIQH